MFIGLDHIIIGVRDLGQATETFSLGLGLEASGGGKHPYGGTANRIIVIGNTYLELITIDQPEEAQQSILNRLAKGDGYLNFVLGSDNLAADTEAMKRRGVKIIGPISGALQSGDGRVRGWQRADVERPDLTQRYPFLIQHDSSGEERRFRLAGWSTPPPHPLGASKVLGTTIVVEDLGEARDRFQRIYGLEPSEEYTGEVDGWDAMLVAFELSGQSFEIATPLPESIDPVNGANHLPERGALRRYLRTYGESLCRMTLEVESLEQARRYLDAHGTTYTHRMEPRQLLWIHPDHACGASIVLYEHQEPEVGGEMEITEEEI